MNANAPTTNYPDPAELNLAQRGYSSWAMIPSFIVCAMVTFLLVLGGWLFSEIRGLGREIGSWSLFWVAALVWVIQIVRVLYRTASYVYILTEKQIYLDRGMFWNPSKRIPLSEIQSIRWGMHFLSRFFRTGWVEIEERSGRKEILRGILHPDEFCQRIEKQRQKAKSV